MTNGTGFSKKETLSRFVFGLLENVEVVRMLFYERLNLRNQQRKFFKYNIGDNTPICAIVIMNKTVTQS